MVGDGEVEMPRSTDRSARWPDGLHDRRRCGAWRGVRGRVRGSPALAAAARSGWWSCVGVLRAATPLATCAFQIISLITHSVSLYVHCGWISWHLLGVNTLPNNTHAYFITAYSIH